MRHRKHTFKINKTPAHRRSMLANMVCSLFIDGRISTTVARCKEARRLAEKMITLGKGGSLSERRRAIATLQQTDVVRELFAAIAPRYAARSGGYTRITKLGQRIGDGAEMAFLELMPDTTAPVAEAAAPAAESEAPKA
jgi:large subunit ribosomal protein L17